MKWWWKSLKQFFNFYPSEKRGVLILMSTLFVLLIFKNKLLSSILEPTEFSLLEKVELFHTDHFEEYPCVEFGGKLTESDFDNIPLDSVLISRILRNYEKYGGYNCISDLMDVRGIDETTIKHIYKYSPPDFFNCSRIKINTATAQEISILFRININKGKTFVKYRNSIGGFVKFEQIKQVYGFPKIKLEERWKDRIDFGNREIQKFDLKKASYKSLLKHGFISRISASRLNQIRKKRPLTLDDIRKEVSDIDKPLVSYYFKE